MSGEKPVLKTYLRYTIWLRQTYLSHSFPEDQKASPNFSRVFGVLANTFVLLACHSSEWCFPSPALPFQSLASFAHVPVQFHLPWQQWENLWSFRCYWATTPGIPRPFAMKSEKKWVMSNSVILGLDPFQSMHLSPLISTNRLAVWLTLEITSAACYMAKYVVDQHSA